MRAKSSTNEPNTDPMTAPAMTPAWFEPDDEAPRVGDEEVDDGKTEDEAEEGAREDRVEEDVSGAEEDVGGGVLIVAEEGGGNVVGGIADTGVGVARVNEVMLDWDSGVPVALNDSGGGEDRPP
jgi:hypothetical protein